MGRLINFKIVIVLAIFGLFTDAYAQKYEIAYEIAYKPKLNSDSVKIEHAILNVDIQAKQSFFENTAEKAKRNYFKRINSASSASETEALIKNIPQFSFNFHVYKSQKENIFFEKIVNNFYQSNYDFPNKWKLISSEPKEIMGYMAKKASLEFGGRTWTAWYSSELPIQDGPYKFQGLPGLILEIESNDHDYKFTAISLKKSDENIKLPNTLPYSAEQLKDLKTQIIESPISWFMGFLKSSEIQTEVSFNGKKITDKSMAEAFGEELNKWLKNHNNPIEKEMIWVKAN